MDVLDSRIIGIGLDTLSHLAAAGLGMLIYSMFPKRKQATAVVPPTVTVAPECPAPRACTTPMEFVSFQTKRPTNQVDPQTPTITEPPRERQARRDRSEIIRMARQMVRAGAERKVIQRTLPISDGELALLQSRS